MSEYRWKIAVFETGEGQFDPKFQVQGDVPHQPFFVSENQMDLSYGITMLAELSFVLSQYTRVTDKQTDGRTDRRLYDRRDRIAYNAAR